MKMPQAIDTAFFAPCGMNCMVCYKHCYVKKPCAGCLPGDEGKPEHCRKCKIKDCVQEKGLTYCYECDVFPCKLIKNLEKSYNQRYVCADNITVTRNKPNYPGNALENPASMRLSLSLTRTSANYLVPNGVGHPALFFFAQKAPPARARKAHKTA